MSKKEKQSVVKRFNTFSQWVTKATGSPAAFFIALLVILVWGISGPFFHYSEVWQLVINTGTTIITFLMMFVIQQSQNKDTMALHLKLNELIAANKDTSNRLIATEDLTEKELEVIKKYYKKISNKSVIADALFETHSLDEADANLAAKQTNIKTGNKQHLKPKK